MSYSERVALATLCSLLVQRVNGILLSCMTAFERRSVLLYDSSFASRCCSLVLQQCGGAEYSCMTAIKRHTALLYDSTSSCSTTSSGWRSLTATCTSTASIRPRKAARHASYRSTSRRNNTFNTRWGCSSADVLSLLTRFWFSLAHIILRIVHVYAHLKILNVFQRSSIIG